MNSILFVVAKNHRVYEQWARKWGIRLKDTQVQHVSQPEQTLGYNKEGCYYTVLNGSNNTDLVDFLDERFTYVPQTKIESKLKDVEIKQYPTQ